MGATHFLTKTLPRISTEMSLHVLAYNLKRMMSIFGIAGLLEAINHRRGWHFTILWLVYPKTNFLTAKVRIFIDFLPDKIGEAPLWTGADNEVAADREGTSRATETPKSTSGYRPWQRELRRCCQRVVSPVVALLSCAQLVSCIPPPGWLPSPRRRAT